eukprot:UN06082
MYTFSSCTYIFTFSTWYIHIQHMVHSRSAHGTSAAATKTSAAATTIITSLMVSSGSEFIVLYDQFCELDFVLTAWTSIW